MSSPARRYTLKAALAATRGALTATNRASRKYAKHSAAWRVLAARDQLIRAERDLREAIRLALDERERRGARRDERRTTTTRRAA